MTTQTIPLHQLSFENALAELEQIVRGLESGQMKLEDAISAYERGAALRRHCEERLGEAEMRVKAIVQKEDGSLSEEELNAAEKPIPARRKKAPARTAQKPQNDDPSAPIWDDNIPF
ncbi:exodeoxyribonuclease VII small subunit [Acetobacteraceae bacterium B3987]|nr:exodeoxyribonuclease VII small subunit [Acetobacteraceae bacterium B3987]